MGHDDQTNNVVDIGDFGVHDPVIEDDDPLHLESNTSGKDEESMQQNNINNNKSQPSIYKNSLEIDDAIDGNGPIHTRPL